MENQSLIKKIINFAEIINDKYPCLVAYLFGSIATNHQNNMSDIDIALMFKESYSDEQKLFIRGELMDLGQGFLNMPVDIVCLDSASVFLKFEIIKNGILLIDNENRASIESLILREYFDFKYYSDIYDEAIIKSIKNNTYIGG